MRNLISSHMIIKNEELIHLLRQKTVKSRYEKLIQHNIYNIDKLYRINNKFLVKYKVLK